MCAFIFYGRSVEIILPPANEFLDRLISPCAQICCNGCIHAASYQGSAVSGVHSQPHYTTVLCLCCDLVSYQLQDFIWGEGQGMGVLAPLGNYNLG